jgi:hypothetical protein
MLYLYFEIRIFFIYFVWKWYGTNIHRAVELHELSVDIF